MKKIQARKLKCHHYGMLRCRGLDPKNYRYLGETFVTVYFLDVRYDKVKILYKYN